MVRDGKENAIHFITYGDAAAHTAAIQAQRARGTKAVPTATQNQDILLNLAGAGHAGADWTSAKAVIRLQAAEDFTVTSQGAQIVFQTTVVGGTNRTEKMRIDGTGNVGIGTANPGSKLAVNIAADGTLQDFEVADAVQGNITVETGTVSYNAFCGSHYTQLKDGQAELPIGAVVISTGEIVPCEANIEKIEEIETEVLIADALEKVDVEKETKEIIGEEIREYRLVDGKIKQIMQPVYAKTLIKKTRLKENHSLDPMTGKITAITTIKRIISLDASNKEYFPYTDTTSTVGDKRVYGVWFGKMSDDARGASFGQDDEPVYLVAQVGLFKVRVTDTNGNIKVGDYLESSSRPMEAQRQLSIQKEAGTIGKAMFSVDWTGIKVDPILGYKWKLMPCIF